MTNYDEPTLRRARSVDGDTRGMMQIRRRLGDVLDHLLPAAWRRGAAGVGR